MSDARDSSHSRPVWHGRIPALCTRDEECRVDVWPPADGYSGLAHISYQRTEVGGGETGDGGPTTDWHETEEVGLDATVAAHLGERVTQLATALYAAIDYIDELERWAATRVPLMRAGRVAAIRDAWRREQDRLPVELP